MKRSLIVLTVLILASLACSESVQTVSTLVPAELPTVVATVSVPAVSATQPLALRDLCVLPVGLWLRSSPQFADDNKVLALPQGTKVKVISTGAWSRIYLSAIDDYGYVRTSYLGDCK